VKPPVVVVVVGVVFGGVVGVVVVGGVVVVPELDVGFDEPFGLLRFLKTIFRSQH